MKAQLEPAYSFFYRPSVLRVDHRFSAEIGLEGVAKYLPYPLNDRQTLAIRQSFEQRLSLLWGPPGTGKTWTLAALIMAWVEAAHKANKPITVLVGASNYNAIDNVLLAVEQLQRGRLSSATPLSIIRIRSDSSEALNVRGIRDIKRSESNGLAHLWASPTESCIVGATHLQLAKISKLHNSDKSVGAPFFDLIVLDEASQVGCATGMSYSTMAKVNAHMVVCGDHRQLGPIQHFEVADTRQGLLESVFQFFKSYHAVSPTSLVENYRSNEVITGWPSVRFYDGFESVRKKRKLDLAAPTIKPPAGWPSSDEWDDVYDALLGPDSPVVVISYEDSSATVSNPFEASLAAALVRTFYLRCIEAVPGLTTEEFWQDRAGLVTPHRAQIATIRNLLGQELMPTGGGLSFVDTVDRFQGQERDLIIASYTVSDPDFIAGEESFILDPRRFNVTLTRARCKFILLVSQSLLNYLPSDMEVATDAAHLQLFTESYCDVNSTSVQIPYRSGSGAPRRKTCYVYSKALAP